MINAAWIVQVLRLEAVMARKLRLAKFSLRKTF